jgi:hypothetical protein
MDYCWVFTSQNHKQSKKKSLTFFLALYVWNHVHWCIHGSRATPTVLKILHTCLYCFHLNELRKGTFIKFIMTSLYKMEVYHKEISPKEFYISRSRWNKGFKKWINVCWIHGHHNKILWLFLSSSLIFLGCYYL